MKYPSSSLLYCWVITMMLFCACRKNDQPSPSPETGTGINKVLDSVFLYAQQIYYWNDQLPSYDKFAPGKYAQGSAKNNLDILQSELFDITRYATNPATQLSFEYNIHQPDIPKYSTILDFINPSGTNNNPVTAASLKSIGRNFGLSLVAMNNNEIRILTVNKDAPAAIAGMKRGNIVKSVNDRIATTSEEFYRFVKKATEDPVIHFTIADPVSGVEKKVTLSSTVPIQNPLFKDTVINIGNVSTGYLAYDRFTGESNTRAYLEPVFNRFEAHHITELIIDLRYNGGGYQSTCQYLANRLVPAADNGKVMFREYYNSMMQQGKASILANQPIVDNAGNPVMIGAKKATLLDVDYSLKANTTVFEKEGGLGQLKRIFFIVSDATASASELLINSLKPYMDVKLIGVSFSGGNVKTYGKPVGFFDISIDKYKIYMSLYNDKNARDEGDFFDGIPADISVIDNPVIDFGDLRDPSLRSAFAIIAPGHPLPAAELLRKSMGNFSVKTIYKYEQALPGLIKETSKLHLK